MGHGGCEGVTASDGEHVLQPGRAGPAAEPGRKASVLVCGPRPLDGGPLEDTYTIYQDSRYAPRWPTHLTEYGRLKVTDISEHINDARLRVLVAAMAEGAGKVYTIVPDRAVVKLADAGQWQPGDSDFRIIRITDEAAPVG